MKAILYALLPSLLSFNVLASDSYTIDSRHTFPSFEIGHLGFSTQRGRFNHTTGKLILDTKSQTGGSLNASIDSDSISTGLSELEAHLRGEDFLNSARFAQITFNSNQLKFSNEQLVAIDGNLNLHGITKPVHLTVDYFHCGINVISLKNVCGANMTTTLKRSDFGIDKYVPMISDEVKIMIQFEAIKD